MLEVLGCPACRGPLEIIEGPPQELRCRECGRPFRQDGQIPVLLLAETVADFDGFTRRYREAHQQEGWQPLSEGEAAALPYGWPSGQPALYWAVRRRSFCALMRILAREGPTPAHGPVADLGAGIGWLSYRLAQLGYQVLALDVSLDVHWGLGAAARYYLSSVHLTLAQGDLEHPPLQAEALALVVLNASLHYAADLGVLRRIARALKPGGRLIVLDTPIAARPRLGSGQGDRHLGREELHEAFVAAGLAPRWVRIWHGTPWWLHQAKTRLKRDAPFSFPMIVADRLP
jgi:SAM-dependent methyltransferase